MIIQHECKVSMFRCIVFIHLHRSEFAIVRTEASKNGSLITSTILLDLLLVPFEELFHTLGLAVIYGEVLKRLLSLPVDGLSDIV